jgi:hypothetical protein
MNKDPTKTIQLVKAVSNVLDINERRPFTDGLLARLLANSFELLDNNIEDFLAFHPKIPLEDNRLVFENPASLCVYAVTPEIKDTYNRTCRLITQVIYANKKQNISMLTKTTRLYRAMYLNSVHKLGVMETSEFHSRRCKMYFSIRLD